MKGDLRFVPTRLLTFHENKIAHATWRCLSRTRGTHHTLSLNYSLNTRMDLMPHTKGASPAESCVRRAPLCFSSTPYYHLVPDLPEKLKSRIRFDSGKSANFLPLLRSRPLGLSLRNRKKNTSHTARGYSFPHVSSRAATRENFCGVFLLFAYTRGYVRTFSLLGEKGEGARGLSLTVRRRERCTRYTYPTPRSFFYFF